MTETSSQSAGPAGARQVGLLGGSFDPPHLAHRALAEAALQQLGLDAVVWLPAGAPWQKATRRLAPAPDRLAMLQLAIAGEPRFSVDERELRRAGPTYTVDTLRELHAEQPATRFWLLIGQDQYARLATWHHWPEVLALAGLAVAARDGQAVVSPPDVAATPHTCRVLSMPALPHSATEVRLRAAAGDDVAALVGAPVARYIAHHTLYRELPEH